MRYISILFTRLCAFYHNEKKEGTGCWWLMPVILTSQETAIRRKPARTNTSTDPVSKKKKKNPKQKRAEWLKV
jgi:hypothetical protein